MSSTRITSDVTFYVFQNKLCWLKVDWISCEDLVEHHDNFLQSMVFLILVTCTFDNISRISREKLGIDQYRICWYINHSHHQLSAGRTFLGRQNPGSSPSLMSSVTNLTAWRKWLMYWSCSLGSKRCNKRRNWTSAMTAMIYSPQSRQTTGLLSKELQCFSLFRSGFNTGSSFRGWGGGGGIPALSYIEDLGRRMLYPNKLPQGISLSKDWWAHKIHVTCFTWRARSCSNEICFLPTKQ